MITLAQKLRKEKNMKLILSYLKNYKLLIVLNILAIFSFALVELGIPTIIAKIIDNGIANQNIAYIKQMGIVIVIISIIGVVGSVLLGYCSAKVSTSVTRDIRNDIFEKSQEFSHTEYNKFGISSMITRTTNDAFQIQQFVNILLRTALLTPVMFIISIIMTIRTSVELSIVLAISVPFIIIGVAIIAKYLRQYLQSNKKD